jgi:hypothetical protein
MAQNAQELAKIHHFAVDEWDSPVYDPPTSERQAVGVTHLKTLTRM